MRLPAGAIWTVIGLVSALGGCASQSLSIHSVPAEDPAAETAAAADSAAAFAAAAGTAGAAAADHPDGAPAGAAPLTPSDAPPMQTYDPWERLNRFTYRFNTRFDEAVFLPVSNTYRLLPRPLRAGVHNFFGNLSQIDSIINYTLQWRLRLGARALARFAINTTAGIGGLLDVASKLKLPAAPTNLSSTLARWGIHPGPYLVIPLLGPSTLRDGIGYIGDYGIVYAIDAAHLYRGNVSFALGAVNAADQRSNVSFRYYSTGSPFEYENIRFLYVHKRLIEDEGVRGSRKPQRNGKEGQPAGK